MPKAKSALLATVRGSLKGGPTFRDLPQSPDIIMQTRPVPTDRRTAKQAAVRDAYARLAYLWKNLSNLDKEPYQIMAEARNLTPWNCWLSFHLPLMRLTPKFYTVFSEGTGTTVQDFAIGGLTGTLNGPSFAEKNQFPCLSFDGVDDRLLFNRTNYYDINQDFSIYIIFNPTTERPYHAQLLGTRPWVDLLYGFMVNFQKPGSIYFRWYGTNGDANILTTKKATANTVNSIFIRKSGTSITSILNGTVENFTRTQTNITPAITPLTLGAGYGTSYCYKGNMNLAAILPPTITNETIAALDAYYRPFFT